MTSPVVLVVEDDPALMRGLSDNFRLHGFEVRTAVDGRSGLAQSLLNPPDLIVLDIMLPLMNGYEICRQIRQQKRNMPIIMLTAKGQEQDIVRGLELGADDYVTKPFSIRELLARARALLRRRVAVDEPLVQLGDGQLDLVSHKLTRDGSEIPLTTKEYRLLAFFVAHRDRALTRNEIIENVWGGSVIITSRSVDRCIATLRAKLEPDTRNPQFIRTIRDIGYRFEIPDEVTD
jgi:two-component system, OmpR family, alkaline phosphatase synthesis response regulator PhoP